MMCPIRGRGCTWLPSSWSASPELMARCDCHLHRHVLCDQGSKRDHGRRRDGYGQPFANRLPMSHRLPQLCPILTKWGRRAKSASLRSRGLLTSFRESGNGCRSSVSGLIRKGDGVEKGVYIGLGG